MNPEEKHAAMFAQMVMQLASTALILMGQAPNPVTGKTETDLDTAQLFVEQLEMLEAKTRGNLGPDEQHLLKQNLMTVRMAFVQAVEDANKKTPPPDQPTIPAESTKPDQAANESHAEDKKKFSKSYGAS
jgi:hypothetical protein